MKTLSEAAWEVFMGFILNPQTDCYEDEQMRREDYHEYCRNTAESAFLMAEAFLQVQNERLPE